MLPGVLISVVSVGRLQTLRPRIATLDTRAAKPLPKEPDPYYSTPEHRAWRADVIKRAGNKCEDCGRAGCRLFADHIKELRDGGAALDLNNGRCRCGSCHTLKTNDERAKRFAT